MKTQNSIYAALPVLFGFFVMGFCDIVGISSDYVQRTFNWSPVMTGFVPSLVFIWFLFLGIPIGNQMKARSDYYAKRAALEQFVGNEVFVQFEADLQKREKGDK